MTTTRRAVPYTGTLPRRANDTTAPWLALTMADAGYTEAREVLGLPRLGDTLHTDAENLWEMYREAGTWEAVAQWWHTEGGGR